MSWDPRLMPPREWPPMEYVSKEPLCTLITGDAYKLGPCTIWYGQPFV